MNNTLFPNWLTETMLKGINGSEINAFLMSLEGWRRGLTLTWYQDLNNHPQIKLDFSNTTGNVFSLSNSNNETHFFFYSMGDLISDQALEILEDGEITKSFLTKNNISVPKSIVVKTNITEEELLEKIKSLSFPLMVKPLVKDVTFSLISNIENKEQLLDTLLNFSKSYSNQIVVIEEQLIGEHYQLYVVNNEVVAAVKKEPANIIGDGIHNIEQLIEIKNKERKKNPYLSDKLIQINEHLINFLQKQNLTLKSIPGNSNKVFLSNQANISNGAETIDVTENLLESIKQTAINAVNSIPGLAHAGVEIIVGKNNKTYVNKLNANADIAMHIFPVIGTPRNVPEYIMDFYYPSTKGFSQNLRLMYYDYLEIKKILRKRYAQEITINDAPKGKLFTRKYIISGKVQNVNYRNWIRKHALKKKIHGYVRNLENGNVEIVVASDNQDKVKKFKETCEKGPSRAKVDNVQEFEFSSSIKSGFEIK